jgi:hypothetical protein
MKRSSTVLLSLILVLSLVGCGRKSVHTFGNSASESMTSIPSKIVSLHTVGFSDTTLALIHGITFGKACIGSKIIIDTLIATGIEFIDLEKRDTILVSSDIQGKYQKHLQPSTYDILVSYVGFNALRIENVTFELSEIKELDVLLGQGPCYINVFDLD